MKVRRGGSGASGAIRDSGG